MAIASEARVDTGWSPCCSLVVLLVLALFAGGSTAGPLGRPTPAAASARRSRRSATFPRPFASQYKKKLHVQVFNRTGNVKKWHLELYTYSGFFLGKSKEQELARVG